MAAYPLPSQSSQEEEAVNMASHVSDESVYPLKTLSGLIRQAHRNEGVFS